MEYEEEKETKREREKNFLMMRFLVVCVSPPRKLDIIITS
jgi:hypothetical protein